ncbi:MAG: nucleotidyltransferase domain-containing protein [Candidatus Bathyarchaeia archaeon]|nr:nucleotidyltransferase domain-containing protein [Candidatus Bathyarchaeia archaeon]
MRKKTLMLFAFTPEGRIVRALSSGEKSFSELVKATGLSERWLSIKLKQLLQLGVVKLSGKGYQVDHEKLQAILIPSLKETAWIAAYEIVEKHPQVLSVLLYGSVAKGKAHEESDVDLLVISENPLNLSNDEYEISMKYGVAFEITSVALIEFLAMLHFKSALLFGILEGYDVLFDRAGITALLKVFMKDIHKNWRYNKDEELWLKLRK